MATLTIKPFPTDQTSGGTPIADGDTAEAVMSKVRLHCDNDTVVVFFRRKGKLVMQVVDRPKDE